MPATILLSLSVFLFLAQNGVGFAQDGTGPLIEQRLAELRSSAAVPALPEIPTDQAAMPGDWLALVSWNVQVGGVSTTPGALRPPLVAAALTRLFSGSYQLLAAQEVSSTANAELLQSLLPGGAAIWHDSFFDTSDVQDNGFWYRLPVHIDGAAPLFVSSMMDASGRIMTDPERSLHPPEMAHFTVGDFDFTLITVHLTFAGGDTSESAREMRVVLDYLDEYFRQPGHDPDVIICGDFNTPSLLSGQSGSAGITLDSVIDSDPRFQTGERRFVVAVHEPTSRSSAANGGVPANNYDHFVLSADVMEELLQARRVAPEILTDDPADPEERLTSDHFPVVALFRTSGEGVHLDEGAKAATGITGVVNGASFRDGIAAGSWITIFGTELASTTRIWRDDEIVGGVLPTSLDELSVLVNGKPAAVYFISPTQLNVEAPDDTALGPVSVEIRQDGAVKATAMAELRQAAPGLFTFDPQQRRYLAAVHLDGTFVGPERLFGDAVVTRPVKPGEVVLLFGTGFGPTDPVVQAGRVFDGAARLKNTVRVLIGGIPADVLFAGLSGAGVNQLNVRIPDSLASGDAPVVAETLGYSSQEGVFLRIEGPESTPPPTVSLTVSPSTIEKGQVATLHWNAAGAQSVEISPGIGAVGASGSQTVSPTSTTTYTITATGSGGAASQSVTLTVTSAPVLPPTVTLTASPESIAQGQSATLQWTSSNATTISIDQGVGVVSASGSRMVTPAATTTYTLTAAGSGGTVSVAVTVTVTPAPIAPPTVTLTASPQTIQSGQSTTLHWTFSNAMSASITPSIGSVTANGSQSVSPSMTTTYTITAHGEGGTRSASVTVTVTSAPTSGFGPCGSKTKCGEMISCAEALYYLNTCKVTRLDGDGDGVPCESICPGG